MKKLLAIFMIASALFFTACGNKDWLDIGNNEFNYAYIQLQNGEVVEGPVESWTDYEGEQIQVVINGKMYLTNSFNCTLVYDPEIQKGGVTYDAGY